MPSRAVLSLAVLVAWPFLGHDSRARAGHIAVEALDRPNGSALLDDQWSRSDSVSEVDLACSFSPRTDNGQPTDTPTRFGLPAQRGLLLACSGLMGVGSVASTGGLADSLYCRPEVPPTELVGSLFVNDVLFLPPPFTSDLFHPPPVESSAPY
jgi:hypothetical protein